MTQPRIHIFVLIDALGRRYVEEQGFLSELLPYRRALRTILGFSAGAIPTILTGALPAQTGHWNLFYHDPTGSPFLWLRHFAFVPGRLLDNRITRKLLKELGRRGLGMGPLFECSISPRLLPYFNYLEKHSIYEAGGIGGAPSIFDQLAERNIPHRVYSYHHWTDQEIFEQARRDLEEANFNFFFLYLSELDSFLHYHCEDSERLEARLSWYASRLRELSRQAHDRHTEVDFTVFSDHGMTPVRHHWDLVKEVESLGFSAPRDYLAVYDSTMARFWFHDGQAGRAVARRLESLPCGRILPQDELRQLGVLFSDRRYGEVIFLMHPGWLVARSDFNGSGWMPAGMHGYHPDDPSSDAAFLSNRPLPASLRSIADVYHCLREAAELCDQDPKLRSGVS